MHFITVDISSILDKLDYCIEDGVHLVCEMEESLHLLFDTQDQDYPPILPLESQIFQVASIPDFLQGTLYVLPLLYHGNLFVRYIASGSYKSALPQILDKLQEKTKIPHNRIFPWEVYTAKDLDLHRKKHSTSNMETTYTRKVGSQDSSRSNKKSVLSLLRNIKPQLDETYTILFIHKAKANPAKPTHR